MYLSTGDSIVNIKKKKKLKIHFLNNTNRNTKKCVFQQEPVLSILKKERIKITLFKQYKQKYYKLCLSTGASIVNIKNTLFKKYKQKY
jgi:hypothetical protein